MALFMDRHDVPGITAEQVAEAHLLDISVAARHGVQFLTYWLDADAGAAFCLARAAVPSDLAAVHGESHGLIPNVIIPVAEDNILKFLGKIEEPADGTAVTSPFRTILFTDLQGSTRLLDALGQASYMVLLTEHDLIIRRALVKEHGREVKHTGDGIMASFESVNGAIESAVRIQRLLAAHREESEHPIQVRIGISAGEPVTEHNDLFGAAVQLAARACAQADPSCVYVSTEVQELYDGGTYDFEVRGPFELKGFEEPIPLYEVAWHRHADAGG
jgi:class 3 adenylate cyclase